MFAAAGVAAHVGNCAIEKGIELLFFLLGKILNHLGFRVQNGLADAFRKGFALGQKVNPLAPTVCFIGAELDELFLLQAGEKTGDRGMGQVEFFFDVPRTGGTLPVGDISQDWPLGGGQVEVHQSLGHALVGAPVKNPDVMAEMFAQGNHL